MSIATTTATAYPHETDAAPGPPCASCQTTGGARQCRLKTSPHLRYDGRPFGFTSKVCKACYGRLRKAKQAVAAGRTPGKMGRPRGPVPPCVKCGTLKGGVNRRGSYSRSWTDSFGNPGPFCMECWNNAYRRFKAAQEGREFREGAAEPEYLPDEAEIRRGREAIRAVVESAARAATTNDKAVARQRVNAERAKVERLLRRAEIEGAMGRACVLARG